MCDQESAVTLEGCQVAGWSRNAIQLAGRARLTCCKSVLAKCGGSGLLVTGPGTSAEVRRSRILGNGRFGVEIVPPRRTLRMRLAGVFAREKRQASPWPGISGAGHIIPDQGEADGNALGVLSPVGGPWPDGFY